MKKYENPEIKIFGLSFADAISTSADPVIDNDTEVGGDDTTEPF